MEYRKIRTFKDLTVWQESHKLVLQIYGLISQFPKSEQYALADQMKRAAVSITSNLAEGFSRRSYKDKINFYYLAKGSLTELHSQLFLVRDLNYCSLASFENIMKQVSAVGQLLQAFIKKTQTFFTR